LDEKGHVKFVQQSPWVNVRAKSYATMLKYLVEFGLSPSSRARIMVEKPGKKDSIEEEFFSGTGG